MVDNLEIKFKELNINVEKEHDLAFIQNVLEEEANGLAIDDDVCGMMLDLCYTKARDLLLEAKSFAHYSEKDDIELEDLDICKDQRGDDLSDAATHIRRSKALVNRYPIVLPNNDSGMILPSWHNCQIGADARLKGAFVKPSKSKDNGTNETDPFDHDDDDDLVHLMDLKKELLNSSSASTSTDSGGTTDDDNDRDSGKAPTAPKKRKLDEPSTPPIADVRKLMKTSGFPESYVPLKSSRSPQALSAATASALEFALMRKPPPPPKMQKVSRSKPKKLKLDPQLIKGEGSTAGGDGGGSSKSKSKQATAKSKGSPKFNTDAEKTKQTNIKNDATSKTLAKGSKSISSTKKTSTGPTATQNDKKGNASNATTTNDKSSNNVNPTNNNKNSVGVGLRMPKINIIQNFKRDPRGPKSRRKR